MNFSDRLKEIRKNAGLSQEQLAEKIGVSRQAVTKWETGKGLPDIENIVIIAEIFKTTLDELISANIRERAQAPEEYTSETAYDIEKTKRFDLKLGCADRIKISSDGGGKLRVILKSDTLSNVGDLFKIKFDESSGCLDVNCVKSSEKSISKSDAQSKLSVEIVLPEKLTERAELSAEVNFLQIDRLNIPRLEFDGNAKLCDIRESSGSVEFTSREDLDITVDRVRGRLDINQWKAKAVVHIPEESCPAVVNKGRKCVVFFVRNGENIDFQPPADAENLISVSGIGSELTVEFG